MHMDDILSGATSLKSAKRFLKNCLHKNVETGFLTATELDNAEQLLIKQVQSTTFAKEMTALQDEPGLLGRIRHELGSPNLGGHLPITPPPAVEMGCGGQE
ncbi:hypothetical protein AVEN_111818-1 [Araneus ventricosus]|uniref:Uncharacterized protein n=1 Tax=Araneus ventricosus TaxID=182803 RepID=A0A4Y2JK72_ARAVE|nr:hypothetical protein AVEN_111818-1 [Araneus ventricosus]